MTLLKETIGEDRWVARHTVQLCHLVEVIQQNRAERLTCRFSALHSRAVFTRQDDLVRGRLRNNEVDLVASRPQQAAVVTCGKASVTRASRLRNVLIPP